MESARYATKLGLDFRRSEQLRVRMDEIDDRIAEVCTRIGMLMEGASAETLGVMGKTPPERNVAFDHLGQSIAQMKALLGEARALLA